jgi:hypothetical protein
MCNMGPETEPFTHQKKGPEHHTYEDPDQVAIKEMKECENKNCAVEVVSNSDQPENSDMEENGNCHSMLQHETSTLTLS